MPIHLPKTAHFGLKRLAYRREAAVLDFVRDPMTLRVVNSSE